MRTGFLRGTWNWPRISFSLWSWGLWIPMGTWTGWHTPIPCHKIQFNTFDLGFCQRAITKCHHCYQVPLAPQHCQVANFLWSKSISFHSFKSLWIAWQFLENRMQQNFTKARMKNTEFAQIIWCCFSPPVLNSPHIWGRMRRLWCEQLCKTFRKSSTPASGFKE